MVGVVLSYPGVSKQMTDVRRQITDERLKNWKMKHLVCPTVRNPER
jgi:hypothetical protein